MKDLKGLFMDFLPDLAKLTIWLTEYGGLFIFVAFTLGILILPVPEETMMLVAGALIKKGKLEFFPIFIGAVLGSCCGITLSYLIGKSAGLFMIHKYGKWIGFTQKRLNKAHNWFEKYGKWSLPIGYFVPGIRHFTGITAGATKLPLKRFMLFAYSGALLWVTLFLFIGFSLERIRFKFFENIEFTFDNIIIFLLLLVALIFMGFVAYKKSKKRK